MSPAPPSLDLDRARSLRQILGTAFGLYRRHFLVFAVPALLVVLVVDGLLVGLGAGLLRSGPDVEPGTGWLLAAGFGAPLVATPLITAMHVRTVQSIARGDRPSVGWALLAGAAVFPIVAPVVVLATLGIALGMLLLIIPGIYVATIWFVGPQAAVVESLRSPLRALARSSELVDGAWWRVFGISVPLYFDLAARDRIP